MSEAMISKAVDRERTVIGSLSTIEARVSELEAQAGHISGILVGLEACDVAPAAANDGSVEVAEAISIRLAHVVARFTKIYAALGGESV